jgi:hypothetical protein
MAVLGFTTVSSKLKEQAEAVKNKGIESFGVSVIDDLDGKHEAIKSSNAQLHLFMQLKRGNITHLVFQDPEQVDVFFANIVDYYGKEKADKALSAPEYIAVGGSHEALKARGIQSVKICETFEDAVNSL